MARSRIALGRDFSFSERTYAFLAGDAIELDEVDGYDVTRRRVLLDEVLLLTRHRTRRAGVLLFGVLMFLFFAWPIALARGSGAWIVFAALSSPFALVVLIHGIFGTDYVTVFGRRSRARIAFNFRKGRAREIFALLAREVEEAQAARRPASQAAPAVAELADLPLAAELAAATAAEPAAATAAEPAAGNASDPAAAAPAEPAPALAAEPAAPPADDLPGGAATG